MFRSLVVLAASAVLATAAHAGYQFVGNIDAGPLSGQAFSGDFDYDTSSLTSVGFESLSLTEFSMNFLLTHYTLNAGATADFQDGVFLGLSYFTSGAGFDLNLVSGSMDATDAFLYYTPANGVESSGGYRVTALPEPASLALALGALAGAGFCTRRRAAV